MIAKAQKDVFQDASANSDKSHKPRSLPFDSGAEFLGTYKDSKVMNGKELLGSTGILNIVSDAPPLPEKEGVLSTVLPTNLLSKNPLVVGHSILGHGETQRGSFSIIWGKVSPLSGKCFWLELADSTESSNIPELVLVAGTFSRDSSTDRSVFRGTWTTRNRRQGMLFLRLNDRPRDPEEAGTCPLSASAAATAAEAIGQQQLNP